MNRKINEQKKNEGNEANEPVGTRSAASHSSGDIWDVVEHVPTRFQCAKQSVLPSPRLTGRGSKGEGIGLVVSGRRLADHNMQIGYRTRAHRL
jgi:hypothetical protein